ncbi:hypothetical protein PCASD_02946 [Puccinia coronata f. sp. avenae]|uniref:Uncharacterized protein n=1 Tax=Puccinia coronata f. sp. avenae TaxID=200324 RepID=A0A2N5VEF0_9BASI|nr:hypothetical protein PCASD_02946 [Puccinia coronata f. sp. avenae]
MSVMDINNFEALLDQPESFSDPKLVPKKKRRAGGHKNHTKAPEELTNELAAVLVVEFKNFFCEKYGTATSSLPEEHFAELEAENVAERLNNIQGAEEIKDLIGGKTINAELEMLYNCVVNFQKGSLFTTYIEEREKYNKRIQDKIKETHDKKQAAIEQKQKMANEVVARKRKRAEEKIAKNERDANEKEAKRLKWLLDSAYIESRKVFHRTKAAQSNRAGPIT